LRQSKKVDLQFELDANIFPDKNFDFEPLAMNPRPEVNYDGIQPPTRLSRAQMSYIPRAKNPESLVLDLGCGHTFHKQVLDHAGYKYVGLDYDEPEAPILGDAHALPFPDNTFDFIMSIAVLEHIINPFIMMKETFRVLKPGGKLLGTVAFLEPFHANSCYHHTHLGTYYTLYASGFKVQKVAPSPDWPVLVAQSGLLFSKMPSMLRKSIVMPVHFLHKLWWKAASFANPKANRRNRILFMTGSFTFLAEKP
jgi:SAM-dependent methyltransferase